MARFRRALRRLRPRLWWLPALLAIAYALDRSGALPACVQQPVGTRVWSIAYVHDGDTVRDVCDRRIRLIGLDAPELGEPLAEAATNLLAAFVAPGPVTVAICPEQPTDRYNRILARLIRGDRDASRELLSAGLATPLAIPPCGISDAEADFATALAARAAGRGLWAMRAAVVDAATAQARGGFNIVHDRIAAARSEDTDLILSLGSKRPYLKVILKPKARAGLDATRRTRSPAAWVGESITVAGKLLGPGGKRIIVWVPQQLDWPQ